MSDENDLTVIEDMSDSDISEVTPLHNKAIEKDEVEHDRPQTNETTKATVQVLTDIGISIESFRHLDKVEWKSFGLALYFELFFPAVLSFGAISNELYSIKFQPKALKDGQDMINSNDLVKVEWKLFDLALYLELFPPVFSQVCNYASQVIYLSSGLQ